MLTRKKNVALVVCLLGGAGGLGASPEPEVGSSLAPLFSYNTDCNLTTVGKGFKVAIVTNSFHVPVCGFQTEVDLATTKALTATGATLTGCADWTGGCRDGTADPAVCTDHWAKSSAAVNVDWSITATTSKVTVYTNSGSGPGGGLTAEAEIGPNGGGAATPIGAQAMWRIPYGNGTFIFEAPFTVNADTTKIKITTEQVHSTRSGSWTNEKATMIWSVYEDENGDCDHDDAGESQIIGPYTTFAVGNDGTKHGNQEGDTFDLTAGVDDYVLRVIMKTDNNAVVFIGGCGLSAEEGASFTTWAKLEVEPAD